jgi:DNA-binding LacI/PurR family transcriptional regulator
MLAERGRRRVAVLATPMLEKPVETVLAARGIPTPRYWIQTVHPMARQGARNAAHLLMSALSDRRPDALLILDDNLVPDATAGLRDAGVSVPSDLTVVAHCNFPHPTPSAVPVIRLGYDVREVLRAGLELLEAQRRGKSSPGEAEVPVVEEQDVSMAGQQGLEPPSSGGEKETRR